MRSPLRLFHAISLGAATLVVSATTQASAQDAGSRADPVVVVPLDGGATPFELTALAREVQPSVVQLVSLDALGAPHGTGTGFFITSSGIVATNHHVIDGAEQMVAKLADGSERVVTGIVAVDEDDDVALVRVEGGGFKALPLGNMDRVENGTPIVILGNPLGLTWSLSEGIVAAIRQEWPDDRQAPGGRAHPGGLIQFNAPVSFGSSGSPVLSRDGQVIGVAQSVWAVPGAMMNFAVPVTELRKLVEEAGETAAPRPFREFPLRNLLVSLGTFVVLGTLLLRAYRRSR